MSILLTLCIALTMLPTTASAACPFDALTGRYEIVSSKGFSGIPADTFTVGERFENIRATIGYFYSGANEAHFGHNPKWWLNGMPLQEGYIFTQVGHFTLTLQCEMSDSEYNRWTKAGIKIPSKTAVASMRVEVQPDVDWGRSNNELTLKSSMSKTTYRQGADEFDPTSILVSVLAYTNHNESQFDLDWDDLIYYAGARGMKYKEHGIQITKGYRFWSPGEKDLWVVVGNKSFIIPFTVTPFVSSVEVTDEPDAGSSTFSKGDYSVKATYTDGASGVLGGDSLHITVKGNSMYPGSEYEVPSGTSTVKLNMGDFTVERKVTSPPSMYKVGTNPVYRSSPDGTVIGTFPADTVLEVTEINGDWATVKYEGKTYYMWASRLTKVTTSSTSTPSNANATVIESGEYYMKIGDRWVYPDNGYNYWLILSDKKPDKPFKVTLVGEDKDRGPEYTIEYWDRYVVCSNNCAADLQLHADINKLTYRINTYAKSGFSTIRPYENQSYLAIGTGGGVFARYSKGAAPDLAKIVFIKADTLTDTPSSTPQPVAPTNTVTAAPSKTSFVMSGKPVSVAAAYTINSTNYLQLRAIAAMLNGTAAQFDVGWDGQYAVIEPGKAYSGAVTETKLQNTTNVRQSGTKFKLGDEVFTFSDARLIDGDTNYLQLREFAQKLSGTASQFNVYWDGAAGQAVIQPGVAYTGSAS